MSDRRGFVLLFVIMTAVAVATGGIAMALLHQRIYDERRANLAEIARSYVGLLRGFAVLHGGDSRTTSDTTVDWLASTEAALPAHHGLGETGEILVLRQTADVTEILLRRRHTDVDRPSPITMKAGVAEPSRRAVAGETGTIIGRDYRGERVLAAYQPVPDSDLAVVAKVDIGEIRAPFLRTVAIVCAAGALLIGIGAATLFAVSRSFTRQLMEGETRFRTLAESASDAFVSVDHKGRVATWNYAAERIFGYTAAEVIGRPVADIVPEMPGSDEAPAARGTIDDGRRHAGPTEMTGLRKDGRQIAIEVAYFPWTARNQRFLTGIMRDISERKRADAALRESEARLRAIIQMQSIAIVIVDRSHEIRFVNKAAEQLFDQSAERLIDAPFGFPMVVSDAAEIEIIRRDHGIVHAQMRAIPMQWEGEEHFLLLIQDITKQKKVEEDLRNLSQAIEQSPASVVITDVNGTIEYVNPKFVETTGYAAEEVVGGNPRMLKSGRTPARQYAELWETIKAGNVWRGEFHNQTKDGRLFWELASIAPVRDPNGKVTHFVAVKEDITERKATEDRLRQAQKMEMIGQLTGGIAHDFNNLLAIILGNLQLLEEEAALSTEGRELLTDAIWSAERGAELTHRLLAFARRQRLNPQRTDLNEVVGDMTELLRRTLGQTILVRAATTPYLWDVMADRAQLESMLLNLVVNARDAMPNGGVLTITTRNVELGGNVSETDQDVRAGEYAMLAVTDTGVGMAPEVLERIFEPFFTTKTFGKGSGLGLSMVYGFVKQSGGQVRVDSTVGQSTTFRIYLPRAVATDAPAVDTVRATASGAGEVILVVEDEPRVRKTTANVLKKQGYTVFEAGGANEALVLFQQLPHVDLLFTDVVLQHGPNGSELAQQIRRLKPTTRILFTSGYGEDAVVRGGLLPRGTEVLPKPYRRGELTTRIRAVLDTDPA